MLIPWQIYPGKQVQLHFATIAQGGADAVHRLQFICRTRRALAAAGRRTAAGFPHVFNVRDGFEARWTPRGIAALGRLEGHGLPCRQR